MLRTSQCLLRGFGSSSFLDGSDSYSGLRTAPCARIVPLQKQRITRQIRLAVRTCTAIPACAFNTMLLRAHLAFTFAVPATAHFALFCGCAVRTLLPALLPPLPRSTCHAAGRTWPVRAQTLYAMPLGGQYCWLLPVRGGAYFLGRWYLVLPLVCVVCVCLNKS
jgi:hypothetical protein